VVRFRLSRRDATRASSSNNLLGPDWLRCGSAIAVARNQERLM
jgi:hypothetical protein